MAEVTFKGNPVHTHGELPAVGSQAPDFKLVSADLSDVSLADYAGRMKILNINPSLDMRACALTAKTFNQYAKDHPEAVVLVITADLPFAQNHFCRTESLGNVVTLSMMRGKDFARDYGVLIEDGPLAGLPACAVVVLDENDRVLYTQLVPEIAAEPDYQAALNAL